MSQVSNLLEKVKSTQTIESSEKGELEIHTLTSHKHLYFYLWSIKSFFWVSNFIPKIVVHDDGTLSNEDLKLLISQINGVEVITKMEADKQILPLLIDYPSCYKYRSEQPFAKKVFDVFLLTNSRKIMILDSDIIFFRKPTEIVDWVSNKDSKMLYNWDPFDTEVSMHRRLERDLGVKYPAGYNSGLQCLIKDIFDIDFLEQYLSYCYDQKKLDWWIMEQRLMALLLYKYNSNSFKPLPRERYFFQNKKNVFYKNRNINSFPKGLVAKHYSRYARTLFSTEEVKKDTPEKGSSLLLA